MAVFRVEKNKDYTVMYNHHLRDMNLSLKAKGLLSQMLSLPDDWDYTLQGLARINREKVDAIRQAVKELELAGYITRSRERDENGRLRGSVYVIREQPVLDLPVLENPMLGNPVLENPTQLNKDILSKDVQNTHSFPFPVSRTTRPERNGTEAADMTTVEFYRSLIKSNIDYEILRERYSRESLDEIVGLMLETVCTARRTVRIAGDDYPAELVRSKFLKLDSEHIEFVFDCMKRNTTQIRNIKKYLLAALFNAPTTIDSYFSALVNHDMYGAGGAKKEVWAQ